MPGKHKRPISIPLKRRESNYVSTILIQYFNPEQGESQLREQSEIIVNEINEKLVKKGFQPIYTSLKLSDWVSNRLYRLRKFNLNQKVTPVIKKVTPVIKKVTPVINKKKNFENNDIYKINLQFINLLPIMEHIEKYDSSLNKVEYPCISIIDNKMFDCLPVLQF